MQQQMRPHNYRHEKASRGSFRCRYGWIQQALKRALLSWIRSHSWVLNHGFTGEVIPWGAGRPSSSRWTKTMRSIRMLIWSDKLLRTSQRTVIDVNTKLTVTNLIYTIVHRIHD